MGLSAKWPTLSMPKRHRTRRANSSRLGTVSPRSDAVSHLFPTRRVQGWNKRQATPLGNVALDSCLASLARCGFDGIADATRFCTSHRSQKSATRNTTPSFAKRGRRWDVYRNRNTTSSAAVALNLTTRKSKNKLMSSYRRFWRFRLICERSTLVLPCDEHVQTRTKQNNP